MFDRRPKTFLHVEDDSDDQYTTTSTIEELGRQMEVKFFSKSYQFLEFLSTAKSHDLPCRL